MAVLPASNYLYAEAQTHQDQCNWINGHVRALNFFGGVVRIVVPDNLKTGVRKPSYYEPDINPAYQALAEHYQFAVLPARVRRPRDKGKVENGVQNVERWVIAPLRKRTFFDLHEINVAITEQLVALNVLVVGATGTGKTLLRTLSKTDVLILNDWLRDPIPLSAAQDLLEVFDDRFGKTAIVIASQLPVTDWHGRFPDPTLADAILDRTIHNAYRISLNGDSQRRLRGVRTMSHS